MRPTDEKQLVDVIRAASAPLSLRGGGTRGPKAQGADLDLSALAGIKLYEPGALTLVAGVGTALAEVEMALAAEGQRLPFEPPDLRAVLGRKGISTLGGIAASNASGPRRVQAGAARDSLIGLRFVDGRGEAIKTGGRVMKNVTGLDLVKLMAGAYGTLGVLTEVAFKLLPASETSASLCLQGLSVAQAVRAMAAALGSPFEVSGAAHDPARLETYLRIEGFDASVSYRLTRLKALLAGQGAEMTVLNDPSVVWAGIRDVAPLVGQAGDLWRLSVQPSTAPGLLDLLPEGAQVLLDWGGGLIWVRITAGTDLRGLLGPIKGHATLMHSASDLPIFHPQTPQVAALSAALRAKFDPREIFNRGIMG
jgi:glycolate oxidase FAD binding subunit